MDAEWRAFSAEAKEMQQIDAVKPMPFRLLRTKLLAFLHGVFCRWAWCPHFVWVWAQRNKKQYISRQCMEFFNGFQSILRFKRIVLRICVSCARTVASNIALKSAQAINHAYVCIVAAPVLTNKYTFCSSISLPLAFTTLAPEIVSFNLLLSYLDLWAKN